MRETSTMSSDEEDFSGMPDYDEGRVAPEDWEDGHPDNAPNFWEEDDNGPFDEIDYEDGVEEDDD
jgi:hypothetical protein